MNEINKLCIRVSFKMSKSTRKISDDKAGAEENEKIRSKKRVITSLRVPKSTSDKTDKYADSKEWKRRKGKVIRKLRADKYTDVRGEEDDLCFYSENRSNRLSNMVAQPFSIQRLVPETYRIMFEGNTMKVVTFPPTYTDVLRGTYYETPHRNGDDMVILHERFIRGKLRYYRETFNLPLYCVQATLFDYAKSAGSGAYKLVMPYRS